MKQGDSIFVAGHRGLVGAALVRQLNAAGYKNLLLRSRAELDLADRGAVDRFFSVEQPQNVILAAAKVGGIRANSQYPAQFIMENLTIQTNVIDAAYRNGVTKLLFLGSSCIYPRLAPQPIREEYLLSGPLEPTNEAYSIAKIAGIRMCQAYRRQFGFNAICVAPTNLYGPGDNFSLSEGHVLATLVRKFHEALGSGATEVEIWGTGEPRREFIHVDDLANACIYLMRRYDGEQLVNIGCSYDVRVADLAELIARVVGFAGTIRFDTSQPDGMPRKLLDTAILKKMGWAPKIDLEDGIRSTYLWYREHSTTARL
jgi:GDP-L-fucose synthase